MFKRLFRSQKANIKSRSTASSDPGVLLKQATKQKREGDINASIQTLHLAYGQIARGETIYTIDTFLRLPLYLQAAGRNDEAWSEFNRLLVEGYPNQLLDQGVQLMEYSKIYDKMRLFLQREGKSAKAIVFGILSMLAWARGLRLQKRREEFAQYVSRDSIKKTLEPFLKKAKMAEHLEQFLELMRNVVSKPSQIDLGDAAKRTGELIARLKTA